MIEFYMINVTDMVNLFPMKINIHKVKAVPEHKGYKVTSCELITPKYYTYMHYADDEAFYKQEYFDSISEYISHRTKAGLESDIEEGYYSYVEPFSPLNGLSECVMFADSLDSVVDYLIKHLLYHGKEYEFIYLHKGEFTHIPITIDKDEIKTTGNVISETQLKEIEHKMFGDSDVTLDSVKYMTHANSRAMPKVYNPALIIAHINGVDELYCYTVADVDDTKLYFKEEHKENKMVRYEYTLFNFVYNFQHLTDYDYVLARNMMKHYEDKANELSQMIDRCDDAISKPLADLKAYLRGDSKSE